MPLHSPATWVRSLHFRWISFWQRAAAKEQDDIFCADMGFASRLGDVAPLARLSLVVRRRFTFVAGSPGSNDDQHNGLELDKARYMPMDSDDLISGRFDTFNDFVWCDRNARRREYTAYSDAIYIIVLMD